MNNILVNKGNGPERIRTRGRKGAQREGSYLFILCEVRDRRETRLLVRMMEKIMTEGKNKKREPSSQKKKKGRFLR